MSAAYERDLTTDSAALHTSHTALVLLAVGALI